MALGRQPCRLIAEQHKWETCCYVHAGLWSKRKTYLKISTKNRCLTGEFPFGKRHSQCVGICICPIVRVVWIRVRSSSPTEILGVLSLFFHYIIFTIFHLTSTFLVAKDQTHIVPCFLFKTTTYKISFYPNFRSFFKTDKHEIFIDISLLSFPATVYLH